MIKNTTSELIVKTEKIISELNPDQIFTDLNSPDHSDKMVQKERAGEHLPDFLPLGESFYYAIALKAVLENEYAIFFNVSIDLTCEAPSPSLVNILVHEWEGNEEEPSAVQIPKHMGESLFEQLLTKTRELSEQK